MKYTKLPLTFDQQADLLIRRGLITDRDTLAARLSQVNYYRLSSYWHPFRQPGIEQLKPGTTLDKVWNRYVFDRQLRVNVMDAIERVEVSLKTRLANHLSLKHGPFGYRDRATLPKLGVDRYNRFLRKLREETDRSKETFVAHFKAKYTSEPHLPIWMAAEIMDFGSMLTLFRGCDTYTQREIANAYGISGKVMESWLMSLNYIRNLCAHHGRLWNRTLPVAPLIPAVKHLPAFHYPVPVPPNTTFAVLTVMRYLMTIIAPQSRWPSRLESLWLSKHPSIPLAQMGFPERWQECPLWNSSNGSNDSGPEVPKP